MTFSLFSVFRPTSVTMKMVSMIMILTVAQLAGVVVSQQTQEGNTTTTDMEMDKDIDIDNAEDSTTQDLNTDAAFTNYNTFRENGQAFFVTEHLNLFENPGSPKVSFNGCLWWNDLVFTPDGNGYVGRGLFLFLTEDLKELVESGATLHQIEGKIEAKPISVSAVYVPKLGLFEGQWHDTGDDTVFRFWDEGKPTITSIGWEGHDAGDTSLNADTSTFSAVSTMELIPVGDAAKYLGVDAANLTADIFDDLYEDAWNKYDTKTIPHASGSGSYERTKMFGMMLVSIIAGFMIV